MNSKANLSGFSLAALLSRQRFWTFIPWLEGEVEGLVRAVCGDIWKLLLREVKRFCIGRREGGGGGRGGGGKGKRGGRGGIGEVG